VPAPPSFDYAVIRIVPRVEREEFLNAGVILFCPERRILAVRVRFDEDRLRALWPSVDLEPSVELEEVKRHLDAFVRVAEGAPDAGPIARLSQRERFHWLAAPRSTIIQVSAVHSGICDRPEEKVDWLFERLVVAAH
jgi:hypothetical protein